MDILFQNNAIQYKVKSPVLLLIFNRPDTTLKVLNQLRKVQPAKLYIAADGPRSNNISDKALCAEARAVIDLIDWDCSVTKLFNEENKGCKVAVSSALDWFFNQEEEGIVLEDDCLPSISFFYFCDILLDKYRLDSRIHNITGTNLQRGKKWGNASYYFSQYSNIWGWASWRRVWNKYDVALKKYSEEDAAMQLKKIFNDRFLIEEWLRIFVDLKAGKIDTWDYQLNFITFFENALCITPNINLISNIGFREDATHTHDAANHNSNIPSEELEEIIHPIYFVPEKEADYNFIKKEFSLEEKWRRYNKKTKRLKRWFKRVFS